MAEIENEISYCSKDKQRAAMKRWKRNISTVRMLEQERDKRTNKIQIPSKVTLTAEGKR